MDDAFDIEVYCDDVSSVVLEKYHSILNMFWGRNH